MDTEQRWVTMSILLEPLDDAELESEYDWHRTRVKHHRRKLNFGLAWWHQLHANAVCNEIGRRSGVDIDEQSTEQLQLSFVARKGDAT